MLDSIYGHWAYQLISRSNEELVSKYKETMYIHVNHVTTSALLERRIILEVIENILQDRNVQLIDDGQNIKLTDIAK
jgi:hypothetical protein